MSFLFFVLRSCFVLGLAWLFFLVVRFDRGNMSRLALNTLRPWRLGGENLILPVHRVRMNGAEGLFRKVSSGGLESAGEPEHRAAWAARCSDWSSD